MDTRQQIQAMVKNGITKDNEEAQTTCPQCGAVVNGDYRCHYCGHLFLNEICSSKYISDSQSNRIASLEKELQKNISLQRSKIGNSIIVTNIYYEDGQVFQLVQSNAPDIGLKSNNQVGITWALFFATKNMDGDIALMEKERLDDFEKIALIKCFKKEHTLDGVKYFIDFGEDSHSAAYIVCEILKKLGFRQDFDIITETLDANEIEMSDDFVGIYVATKSITKKETKRKILIRLLLAIAMLIVFIIVQILL